MFKKSIMSIFIILIAVFAAYSDTVILKSGDSVKGKILEVTDSQVVLDIETGKLFIDKEKIRALYYDDETKVNKNEVIKDEEPSKKNKKDDINADFTSDKDADLLYKKHRSFIKAGVPLIIIGTVLIAVPAIFATAPLVIIYSNSNGSILSNPLYITGLSWYLGIIAVGLSLDVIAIVCFAAAGKTYKEWKQTKNISFNTGFVGDRVNICLGYKF